ncbi:MAG: integrase arm-type DNA-binding domain-containing protein [Pseudomonadota bacterium]
MVPSERPDLDALMMALTKTIIDGLVPEATDYVRWDHTVRGLGVRVRPTGKKVFIVKYRTTEGRQRKLTLGPFGTLTLDQARRRARQALAEAAGGEDPAAQKSEARKAVTFGLFAERYLTDYAERRKKARSVYEDRRMLQSKLVPHFGALKLKAIERKDVASFHQSMADTPYAANRHLALLSKMMNLAEEWGLRPEFSNPCRHVSKFKEKKRERFLSADEIQRLWFGLEAMERDGVEPAPVCAAIKLLLLTGCRLSEILTLEWVHVRDGYLDLPATKSGPQRRRISDAAIDILSGLHREPDNPFVIPGHLPGMHLVELERPWRRIRARLELDDVRLHDLRHTFASLAAAQGQSLLMIGELLGHRNPQTTARYAHLNDRAASEAANQVGRALGTLFEAKR